MADLDSDTGFDEQDQSEVFDEDNTELESQTYGGRDNEDVFEALPEVLDVTRAVGDEDDDDSETGEGIDDDDLVALASEDEDDDDALDGDGFDGDGLDAADRLDAHSANEVELEYRGDLTDLEGAASAAQSLESARLSDADLHELDYKDEFTRDDDDEEVEAAAPPT